jgi:hypothetical protein
LINREVKLGLLAKLHITPQALSQRAKRIKNKFGPMTSDEAVYIIAHVEGINLAKYLPLDTLDRIRSLIPREIKPQPISQQNQATRKKIANTSKVRISYPLVSNSFIQQTVVIGDEPFPQIVVLENSIRNLIENTLTVIRSDWWIALVPENIQKKVQKIIDKEKEYPYREKRGNRSILYCNFADLKEIIIANYIDFRSVIVDIEWFKVKMDEVYMARNNLAHSILLTEDDISRIALFYRDWARLLETANIIQDFSQ